MPGKKALLKSDIEFEVVLIDAAESPIERPKKKSLLQETHKKEEKQANRAIATERVLNKNVIGCLKRFKILSDRYRNRRKRFGLRFNLIAGIYNADLSMR